MCHDSNGSHMTYTILAWAMPSLTSSATNVGEPGHINENRLLE